MTFLTLTGTASLLGPAGPSTHIWCLKRNFYLIWSE